MNVFLTDCRISLGESRSLKCLLTFQRKCICSGAVSTTTHSKLTINCLMDSSRCVENWRQVSSVHQLELTMQFSNFRTLHVMEIERLGSSELKRIRITVVVRTIFLSLRKRLRFVESIVSTTNVILVKFLTTKPCYTLPEDNMETQITNLSTKSLILILTNFSYQRWLLPSVFGE